MIKPTVGRVVWFWESRAQEQDPQAQPQAAIVTRVHDDRCIDLHVMPAGAARAAYGLERVTLQQVGDVAPDGAYAQWMPYQVEQAKRHEQEATK